MTPQNKHVLQGIAAGLIAAVCYGFIPLFTLPLKTGESVESLSDSTILFYRFGLAALIIGFIMLWRRADFRITRGELVTLTYLAFLSDGAALFLIDGYDYLSSGVATTLHFMYPVMTAIIMMCFYHEARRVSTIAAIVMAVAGVGILSWDGGQEGSLHGVAVELISALCYAFYLIRVNRSRAAHMDTLRLVFYILAIGAVIFLFDALRENALRLPAYGSQWVDLGSLALICTVVTNLCLVVSVKRIGSTMTAVIGALEPLTAVGIGCLLFAEPFTWQVALAIALIIPAVVIIILTRHR